MGLRRVLETIQRPVVAVALREQHPIFRDRLLRTIGGMKHKRGCASDSLANPAFGKAPEAPIRRGNTPSFTRQRARQAGCRRTAPTGRLICAGSLFAAGTPVAAQTPAEA